MDLLYKQRTAAAICNCRPPALEYAARCPAHVVFPPHAHPPDLYHLPGVILLPAPSPPNHDRSLESFVRCLLEWGWLRPRAFPARMDVALFAAGCGAIMHCYSDGNGRFRDCFRSKYRNLLDFVFGGEGEGRG